MSSDVSKLPLGVVPTVSATRSGGSATHSTRESEARYHIFFQKAPVALWDEDFSPVIEMLDEIRRYGVIDLRAYFGTRQGLLRKAIDLVRLNDMNEFTLKLFEAPHKARLLRSLADVFLPQTEAVFLEELITLWEGHRRFESETVMRTLSGRPLNVIFTVAYEGERCEHTLVSIVDVTARKRAEQKVRQLAAIVESSDDGIASMDIDGNITSWNPGAERLYGYSADEIVGQPLTKLVPLDRQDEDQRILARIRSGDHVDHYETIRRHKDGTLMEVSLSVSPIQDEDGRIIGAARIARDITDRKQAQERQKLLLHEMKHRIKNSLTTVQAIASQTLVSVPADERDAFEGRLQALARAHDLLTVEGWDRMRLFDVVEQALDPFQEGQQQRFIAGGPEAILSTSQGLLIGLALHELATNSVKYGALSTKGGRVRIAWDIIVGGDVHLLKMSWRESGGPAVSEPTRKGFGSFMIERAITSELGSSRWEFLREGVNWSVELPLAFTD